MKLRVHHRTEYTYESPVTQSVNELRLRPLNTRAQLCLSSFISVLPPTRLLHYHDLFRNTVHRFEIPEAHNRLVVESRCLVERHTEVDFDNLPYGSLHEDLPYCRQLTECHEFLQGSFFVELSPEMWRQAIDVRDHSKDVFQTSYAIMRYIFDEYQYDSAATNVSTHANEVFVNRKGVCQDFAHVMLGMCRSIGIPARYVSGYFLDTTKGHRMRGSDASHAWVEVYLSAQDNWVGLDPTNNQVVDDRYIKLATGRDYRDAAPIEGTYWGGGGTRLSVRVTVDQPEAA
ncbi:MAG: transglutaminase family protein [Verrucomicrobiota bacterium]